MKNNLSSKSNDKKKLKKIILIVIASFIALSVIAATAGFILDKLKAPEDYSYSDDRFFEPDYSKNIYEDELYLGLQRGIHYNRYGDDRVLTESNLNDFPASARFFYNYFNCIINGDYQNYPSFFTESARTNESYPLPEKFTMQGLYNIEAKLFSSTFDEDTDRTVEIFEVSYQIFENNGTFRRDILSNESRTLVFELYIQNGEALINAIGFRQTVSE